MLYLYSDSKGLRSSSCARVSRRRRAFCSRTPSCSSLCHILLLIYCENAEMTNAISKSNTRGPSQFACFKLWVLQGIFESHDPLYASLAKSGAQQDHPRLPRHRCRAESSTSQDLDWLVYALVITEPK
jgi:hypothetical protein